MKDGKVIGDLPLPVAGLMSDKPAEEVATQMGELLTMASGEFGINPEIQPLMTLVFISLEKFHIPTITQYPRIINGVVGMNFQSHKISLVFTFILGFQSLCFAGGYQHSDHLVVVHNTDLIYHQKCLGFVYNPTTVVVPSECAYHSFGEITVYETPEDSELEQNAIATDVKTNLHPTPGAAAKIHLRQALKYKKPARVALPDLNCNQVWHCYYLAENLSVPFINHRTMRTHDASGMEMATPIEVQAYYMVTGRDDDPDSLGIDIKYIEGAILFDDQNQIVGVSFDELSIYMKYESHRHKFYRINYAPSHTRTFFK